MNSFPEKIKEHDANLIDDYSLINDAALNAKKQYKISEWVDEKIKKTKAFYFGAEENKPSDTTHNDLETRQQKGSFSRN